GETSLLTGKPRNASVSAVEPCELLVLERDDFLSVARDNLAVAAYFRALLGARFGGASNQPLLLPDPISTMLPRLGARGHRRYWAVLVLGQALFGLLTAVAFAGGDPRSSYALIVVGSLIVPVVFVQYLAESNILSEHPLELLGTGVLGAALGLPLAYLLQHVTGLAPRGLRDALL